MRQDDLTPMLGFDLPQDMTFYQGKVISFDLANGNNEIEVRGAVLVNIPVLNITDAAGLLPGMVVGLLRWRSSWWIIGRIAVPGNDNFGDLTVRSNNGAAISLKDGEIRIKDAGFAEDQAGSIKAGKFTGSLPRLDISAPFTTGTEGENRITISGRTSGNSGFINVRSGGTITVHSQTSVVLRSDTNQFRLDILPTTSSAANMFVDGIGMVHRSTSARRYKKDIRNAAIDWKAVLKMQPRTWIDKNDPKRVRHIGFVAEELMDLGLDRFVTLDESGQPDAIAYDRLSAGLVKVAQAQQEQIDKQAELIKQMNARLNEIEKELNK